jgi:prepilin-type N-terminal cleavage/methylation domain-containing protein
MKDETKFMKNKKNYSSVSGFTLTELLVVIAILGILLVIAVPSYLGQQKRAARSEAFSNLQNLRLLEEQAYAENATYVGPAANEAAITALMSGFRPGTGLSFTYAITSVANGVGLPNPVPVPYDGSTANLPNANTPCFIATATGNAGSRVAGDVFTIDCNNNRNF